MNIMTDVSRIHGSDITQCVNSQKTERLHVIIQQTFHMLYYILYLSLKKYVFFYIFLQVITLQVFVRLCTIILSLITNENTQSSTVVYKSCEDVTPHHYKIQSQTHHQCTNTNETLLCKTTCVIYTCKYNTQYTVIL